MKAKSKGNYAPSPPGLFATVQPTSSQASLGNFQLLVQVFAASIGTLQPGSWNSKRPRLEAELGLGT